MTLNRSCTKIYHDRKRNLVWKAQRKKPQVRTKQRHDKVSKNLKTCKTNEEVSLDGEMEESV
ncbi:Hypothetical protein CINCED_3A021600 [Cinara cedri]|uniref:Uncharacterized protein n=1 Tax=Cinara cedri TaxID=506608 RepID=A0A5E4NL75_9HEMI|nr:Hypothetical protein CINCED_3A021600 [Cinara cedri]